MYKWPSVTKLLGLPAERFGAAARCTVLSRLKTGQCRALFLWLDMRIMLNFYLSHFQSNVIRVLDGTFRNGDPHPILPLPECQHSGTDREDVCAACNSALKLKAEALDCYKHSDMQTYPPPMGGRVASFLEHSSIEESWESLNTSATKMIDPFMLHLHDAFEEFEKVSASRSFLYVVPCLTSARTRGLSESLEHASAQFGARSSCLFKPRAQSNFQHD